MTPTPSQPSAPQPILLGVPPTETVNLQYWNGKIWMSCGTFFNQRNAWNSLGGDNLNYRVVDTNGNVLIENRPKQKA